MNTKQKTSQRGSSLIELIIATMVVGLVLTAIAAALTYSVKSTAESKYRSLATNKVQEVVEVFRREKTILGWDEFYSQISADGGSFTYCLDTLPSTSSPPTVTEFVDMTVGTCSTYGMTITNIGTSFKREAEITVGSSSIKVEVFMYWPKEGGGDHSAKVVHEFKEW